MVTALIFAGGTGRRMTIHGKPKQFLELHGKPIIVYTLEHFEYHPKIDNILVVCVEHWIKEFNQILKRYAFSKVQQIVPGGDSGDVSIFNGLKALEDKCESNDIVLIHDGVRPLINSELISANIENVEEFGNAITVEPVTESIVRIDGIGQIVEVPPRREMFTAKAPQSFRYGLIWKLYQRARKDGLSAIDSAHLCSMYDVKMHTVTSTQNNIKITTPSDYYIFRALYEAKENEQIFGM